MMQSKKGFALLMGLAMAHPLFAVGVGEIKLHSSLNQPFDADVPLYELGPVSLDQIEVAIASQDSYEKMGLIRQNIFNNFIFEARSNTKGESTIHFSSSLPIKDPVIQLLVTFTWPDGKIERNFTLFLDPAPVHGGGKPTVVNPKAKLPSQTYNEVEYGPVKHLESLWILANQLKRPESMSVEAFMNDIYKRNPEAFAFGDPNSLMEGVYIKVATDDVPFNDLIASARFKKMFPNTKMTQSADLKRLPDAVLALNDMAQEVKPSHTIKDFNDKSLQFTPSQNTKQADFDRTDSILIEPHSVETIAQVHTQLENPGTSQLKQKQNLSIGNVGIQNTHDSLMAIQMPRPSFARISDDVVVPVSPSASEIQLQRLREENQQLHDLIAQLQSEHKMNADMMLQQQTASMPVPASHHFWESISLLVSAGLGFMAALFAMRFFERGTALNAYGRRNQITHHMNLKDYVADGIRPH